MKVTCWKITIVFPETVDLAEVENLEDAITEIVAPVGATLAVEKEEFEVKEETGDAARE